MLPGSFGRLVERNVAEVLGDAALRGYGVALALVHVVTWLHWGLRWGMDVPRLLADRTAPICWPFFQRCDEWRRLGETSWRALLAVYVVLALIDVALFAARRVGPALALLGLLSVAKWLVLAQDYRLGGNYHYMAFITTAAFLVLPGKRDLGRLIVVAFYVSAAALKLNYDWLSGESLHRHVLLHGVLLRVATTYVVVLETVIVLGLLLRPAFLFWGALVQLVLFHLYSVTNVGTPYPLFMACLLAIFPLARSAERDAAREGGQDGVLARLLVGRSPSSHYFALAAYTAAQLMPLLNPGDAALTGRGRAFALTMFDARTSCDVLALARHSPHERAELSLERAELLPRIHCDPVVFASFARETCRELRRRSPAAELDVYAVARRAGDARSVPLLVGEGACTRPLVPSTWRRTDWIRP